MKLPNYIKEAYLYDKLNGKVRCKTCNRKCTIAPGKLGFCKTRKNIEGKLYTLEYGLISSIAVNPIEKKPLFHFWPGSDCLTIGSWSCTFTCPWCIDPDTDILVENGYSVKIRDLENCWRHNKVLSFNQKNKIVQPSEIISYIKIRPKIHGLKVFKIITEETGRELIATEDHPVYTERGLIPIRGLSIGDKVIVYPMIPIRKDIINKDQIVVSEENIADLIDKFVPRSNKKFIVESLKKLGLIPLLMANEKLPILARLLGFLFGDGTVSLSRTKNRDKLYMMFTGRKEDLLNIKKDIKTLGFSASKIVTREKKSTIFRYGKRHTIIGKETHFTSSSKALCILMIALGAPVGDKAKTPFYLPDWLFHSPIIIKKEFVAGYFGSELTRPRIDLSKKTFFQPRFSINKIESLFKNAVEFVEDLKRLLADFDVKISSYNWHEGSVWKDGTKTLTLYVLFANNIDNLINLFGRIGYRYCTDREILSRQALEYLLFKKKVIENRKEAYKNAVSLKRNGISFSKIYQKLQKHVDKGDLNLWVYRKVNVDKIKTPLKKFPTFEEWQNTHTKNLKNGMVWETIEKIEKVDLNDVRDLTVNKFHNFFANGFLVSNCQNFDISKVPPNPENSIIMAPKELIDKTIENLCQGTSMSFSEPTTFLEYSIDVFKLAKKEGLYNTFISNGYFTTEALDLLIKSGCDAFNIDIKGDKEAVRKYCGADVEFVWQNSIEARKKGVWVELTTLVIPGVNDDEKCLREIARRIHDEVGDDTPWHISRYYPCYKFSAPPTPVETLEKAFKIGKEEGLKFIYVGNVPGHKENTYCPSCGKLLIERFGFDVLSFKLTKENKCPNCGEKIPIIGKFIKRERIIRWF